MTFGALSIGQRFVFAFGGFPPDAPVNTKVGARSFRDEHGVVRAVTARSAVEPKPRSTNMTQRIYYTGDMANLPGWFQAFPHPAGGLALIEEPNGAGRTLHVQPHHVGDVYEGHCSPRFVTEAAYEAYRTRRREEAEARIPRWYDQVAVHEGDRQYD